MLHDMYKSTEESKYQFPSVDAVNAIYQQMTNEKEAANQQQEETASSQFSDFDDDSLSNNVYVGNSRYNEAVLAKAESIVAAQIRAKNLASLKGVSSLIDPNDSQASNEEPRFVEAPTSVPVSGDTKNGHSKSIGNWLTKSLFEPLKQDSLAMPLKKASERTGYESGYSGYEEPCYGFPLEIRIKSRIKPENVFPILGKSKFEKCIKLE